MNEDICRTMLACGVWDFIFSHLQFMIAKGDMNSVLPCRDVLEITMIFGNFLFLNGAGIGYYCQGGLLLVWGESRGWSENSVFGAPMNFHIICCV